MKKFFLKIQDKKLEEAFLISRNKEITFLSSVLLVFRLIVLIGILISQLTSGRKSPYLSWIIRGINAAIHLALILIGRKFPIQMCQIHGPIIIPLNLINLMFMKRQTLSYELILSNLYGYMFYGLAGILLNANWIYTGISIIIFTVTTVVFYCLILLVYDVQGLITCSMVSILIIYSSYYSELKQKENFIQFDKIQHMNNDLQHLLTNLPDGIILYDQDNKSVKFINQEFRRMIKCAPDSSNEEISRKIQEDKTLQVEKQAQANDEQGSQSTQSVNVIEAATQFSEGQTFILQEQKREERDIENQQTNPIDQQQEIVSFNKTNIYFQNKNIDVIIVRNQTQVFRYEKLKMENHFLEMLTATVSHDMRTPLNAIIGLLNNLETHVSGNQEARKFIKIIRSSSQLLLFLVNDLLDYFQIKNGKFKKNVASTNIKLLIKSLLEIFEVGAQEKGIRLQCHFDESLPDSIYVDEQRLKQVAMNLIQNAFKFTLQGTITVSVSYDQGQQQLKVNVKDTGLGIKEENRQKLFVLFGKLDQTSHMNTTGIGLGLSICKKIVAEFDGDIWLEDGSEQEGCSFTFAMRCQGPFQELCQRHVITDLIYKDVRFKSSLSSSSMDINSDNFDHSMLKNLTAPLTATRQIQPTAADCICPRHPRILIVDDNIFNVITLQTIIEHTFHLPTDKALNGQQAVQKVLKRIEEAQNNECDLCESDDENLKHYDLIFMDCNMPVLDGFQASAQIRKIENEKGLSRSYITALTAYSTNNFKIKCEKFGMDDFKTKPVDSQEINQLLQLLNLID